jgi:7-cyano-7-deazaguanine synthase
MKNLDDKSALVLFSGGQDSTTMLAMCKEKYNSVFTLTFDYGQRHRNELTCVDKILDTIGVDGVYKVNLPSISEISKSYLLGDIEIENLYKRVTNTFLPGRNLIFLSYAGTLAYTLGCKNIAIGVCQTDFSGFPDCRDSFLSSMQETLKESFEVDFNIYAPLLNKSKCDIWKEAYDLGLIELIKSSTHTCYNNDYITQNKWGFGCNNCPSCNQRRIGYENFTNG